MTVRIGVERSVRVLTSGAQSPAASDPVARGLPPPFPFGVSNADRRPK